MKDLKTEKEKEKKMDSSSVFLLMLPAFFECLVLVGIHSYLGIHVIKRKVIFVDLAFAQIAALGILIAFLFGIPPHTKEAFVFAMGLTFIGAVVISLTRFKESKIPQEAIIGLIYAIAAAVAILLIDKAPHGAEHIKEVLTGSILWVKWKTIGVTAAVYALVGLFHYIFREKFLLISNDPVKAWASGINVRLWDFLFYASFGLVITMSVDTAGVLIVFVFLVAPAIIAIIITDRMLYQLLIGWGLGMIVTTIGLFISYVGDLPTGPAVIGAYAVAIIFIAAILYNVRSQNRKLAFRNTAIVAITFIVALFLMFPSAQIMRFYLGENVHEHGAHREYSGQLEEERKEVARNNSFTNEGTKDVMKKLPAINDIDLLEQIFAGSQDDQERSAIVSRALEIDRSRGTLMMIAFLNEDPPFFFRQEVISKLHEITGEQFEFDARQPFSSEVNQRAAARLISK